jgi:ribosomal RNA-processing protein 8
MLTADMMLHCHLVPVQKVHSFDLVAAAPHVVACNMAHVPLEDASVDVAVFSLALMGTD